MSAIYTRASDLKEKVEELILKKIEWKILFSVNGKRDVGGIAERVGKEGQYISQTLEMLASKNLVELSSGTATNTAAATTSTVKETVKEEVGQKTVDDFVEAKKVEKPKEVKPPAKVAASGAGGPKILVVDDSVVIQKMVEIAFENETVQLTSAMKGADAITTAGQEKPDVILLDIMLPDMSGLEVIKKLKEISPDFGNIPIIILSGRESSQDKDSAISAGANDFLTKPFHDEDLVAKVKQFVS